MVQNLDSKLNTSSSSDNIGNNASGSIGGSDLNLQSVMQVLNDLSPRVREIWSSVVAFSGPQLSRGRDFASGIPTRVRANPWPYVAIGAGLIAFALYRRGSLPSFSSFRGSDNLRDQAMH